MATAINEQEVQSHLHPTPSWNIDDHPVPTGREEIWRFSPIRVLSPLFEDQTSDTELNWDVDLPVGVSIKEIDLVQGRELAIEPPVDRVSALAVKNSKHTLLLEIADETVLTEPLVLTLTGVGADKTVHQHLVIKVGKFVKADITLRHLGEARLAGKIDLITGDNSEVSFASVQDWSGDSLHGGQISVLVGRDAKVKTVQASFGGAVNRIVERTQYAGPGGEVEQLGVYFVNGKRHVEHRVFVDHNQPNTVSNVDYRGALQHEGARSVWVGDVLIRPTGVGIDTYESNKNLLLTDGCQADSIPNLEIETGDIAGAGHSASTGRFDEEQLFYLQSRGLTHEEAKKLMVQGFFNEIIKQIGVPQIEARLKDVLDNELEAVSA